MTRLKLVQNGEMVGYVDTETGEAEYNGDNHFVKGMVEGMAGKYIGPESRDGPNKYFVGDKLEEYIRKLPEEEEEVEFEVYEAGETVG